MKTKIYILSLLCLLFAGCHKEDDVPLYFFGDSTITRWDLAEDFPSRICYNDGLSGATLDYARQNAGRYAGCRLVVILGTNDAWQFSESYREEYAREYLKVVKALGASRTYLFSLLPRDFEGDPGDINQNIRAFNSIVEELTAHDPSIVYINVYSRFMRDGEPNPQYFSDGLHLSAYGYEILRSALYKYVE